MARVDKDKMKGIFSQMEGKKQAEESGITHLPCQALQPFHNHPFKRYGSERMADMVRSISQNGIINPLVVRPLKTGGMYEVIAGHNRLEAAKKLGMETVPVLVREVDDATAAIMMVDTNFHQRDEILPSEKAFAYQIKLNALKQQGKRTDTTSSHSGTKWRSDETVAEESGETRMNIHRYIRLTHLIPELLDKVDTGALGFIPAVNVSYLGQDKQTFLNRLMDKEGVKPTKAQAAQMKSLAQQAKLTQQDIKAIMAGKKESAFAYEGWKPGQTFKRLLPKPLQKGMTQERAEAILRQAMQLWNETYGNTYDE